MKLLALVGMLIIYAGLALHYAEQALKKIWEIVRVLKPKRSPKREDIR